MTTSRLTLDAPKTTIVVAALQVHIEISVVRTAKKAKPVVVRVGIGNRSRVIDVRDVRKSTRDAEIVRLKRGHRPKPILVIYFGARPVFSKLGV